MLFRSRRRQKPREETPETGIHRNVCPFCQCGQLFAEREALANDDDNTGRSTDEGDDKDTDSEMGSLESLEDVQLS